MTLTDSGHLSIAVLVFWIPAFFLSAFIATRHGLSHHNAWIFIALLGVCRIIFGSCTIAFEEQTNPSGGLVEAAAITGSLGLSILLIALSGMHTKTMSNMSGPQPPPHVVFLSFYAAIVVGVALSIVGVVNIIDSISNPAQNANDYKKGYDLFKAGILIFLIVVVALAGVVAYTMLNMSRVRMEERRLVLAVLLSLPFVFLRVLYGILTAFVNDSTFNILTPGIWAQSFMQIFEEMTVGIIFIVTGFAVGKPSREEKQMSQVENMRY